MSLRPEPIGEIPAETARVARAAFPKGTLVTRLRDEFSVIYRDEDFGGLYPGQGQPALLAPWRLALVTVLQFLENLSDRQAAGAVRARIGWKVEGSTRSGSVALIADITGCRGYPDGSEPPPLVPALNNATDPFRPHARILCPA